MIRLSPQDIADLRQRAERATGKRGGVVAVDGATLLRLLDGYVASPTPQPPTGDARELAYHALVGLTDPQATLRKLSSGRIVMVADTVWDNVTAALNALASGIKAG